ncbi:lipid transfer-like protein VAS [Gossypium australe]|uniref:Lipid transfer-like protein VAS n=1 Tax=Gossypium australe TaxID=47621 RepID=A0A5B6UVP9_9ROSI|nr:lipid transfer-like protein VAS [Gossypium australe]
MAKLLMVVIYVMMGTMATVTDGQATCAQKLVPCAPYLDNSTAKPQNYCCNSIREAVANELPCLCNLYKDPTLLASFNVTVAELLGSRVNVASLLISAPATDSRILFSSYSYSYFSLVCSTPSR